MSYREGSWNVLVGLILVVTGIVLAIWVALTYDHMTVPNRSYAYSESNYIAITAILTEILVGIGVIEIVVGWLKRRSTVGNSPWDTEE